MSLSLVTSLGNIAQEEAGCERKADMLKNQSRVCDCARLLGGSSGKIAIMNSRCRSPRPATHRQLFDTEFRRRKQRSRASCMTAVDENCFNFRIVSSLSLQRSDRGDTESEGCYE
jgi:hypothetical protein